MLLPIVLIFSLIIVSSLNTYLSALSYIDIFERELARLYIADYYSASCLRIVAETFVHDPNTYFDNDKELIIPISKDNICYITLNREVDLDNTDIINIYVGISINNPTLNSHQGLIKFKDQEIEEILMKI